MYYALKNFAWGELASDVGAADMQVVLVSGNNLPKTGTFIAVVWDMSTYPNPADDPKTEIMELSYSGMGETFDVTRARESTLAVAHDSGDQVALHLTAGVLESERLVLGSAVGLVISDNVLSVDTGYSIPTDVLISNWDIAYSWGNHADAGYLTSVSGQNHSDLDSLSFVESGHTGFQAQADILDDLGVLGAPSADGEFIVATGAGSFSYESGNTARTSLGLGTGNSPSFTSLVLTSTTNTLYAGPWTTVPSPMGPHSSIYGDLFVGFTEDFPPYDGLDVGRLRIGSSLFGGFVQFNRYWDGTASQQFDTSRSSWSINLTGEGDYLEIARAPAGSTTLTSWFNIDGANSKIEMNPSGEDIDFIVEGDTDTDLIHVDAANDNLGIGIATPRASQKVHVYTTGWTYGTQFLLECGDAKQATLAFETPSGTGYIGCAGTTNQTLFEISAGDMFIANRGGGAIRISADTAYHSSVGINLLENGNCGFGLVSPQENVHSVDTVRADVAFNLNGVDGWNGSFTNGDGNTVTVAGGIITGVA